MDFCQEAIQLAGGFELRTLPADEFQKAIDPHHKAMFDDTHPVLRLRDHLPQATRDQLKVLKDRMGDPHRVNLAAFHQGEIAGWSFGFQESQLDFYMCNSAVLPDFRR